MSVELVKQPKSDLSQLLELLESGGGENQSKASDSLPSTRSPTSQEQRRNSDEGERPERKRLHSDRRNGSSGRVTDSPSNNQSNNQSNPQPIKRPALEPS
uniref:Uncharacterized protein n=1 Tax=Plectus sambesii TaxID=2011161 RepID=A0A914V5R5_9BILA